MTVPSPTPIYRIIHVDNLEVCLQRSGLHAPNHTPSDGLPYKMIHNASIQAERQVREIVCGPCGVVHDYVPFYFGYRSPMLFQLKTGWVEGYDEGQEPIIYLVSKVQSVAGSGAGYVFSDGQGIAAYTTWYDDLSDLNKVDWNMVYERYWSDTVDSPDRQRRKQAEFLVHQCCDWSLIQEIATVDDRMKKKVEAITSNFPSEMRCPVCVRPEWYY